MRGKKETDAFNRKIPDTTVRKAFVLTTVAFMLVMFASLAVQALEIGNISQTYYYYDPTLPSAGFG
jgi:Trk-type K+ transport system membrane component